MHTVLSPMTELGGLGSPAHQHEGAGKSTCELQLVIQPFPLAVLYNIIGQVHQCQLTACVGCTEGPGIYYNTGGIPWRVQLCSRELYYLSATPCTTRLRLVWSASGSG